MATATESPLLVACLCAGWCRTCEAYRPGFEALARQHGAALQLLWVDVEDQAELLGDELDIVNFPTLLIAQGEAVGFFGTVLPHLEALQQLVARGLAGQLDRMDPPALAGLPARLRAWAAAAA